MNDGRLILVLYTAPNPASGAALKQFLQHIKPGDKPTIALGLLTDITLALTSRHPGHIYNAFEFMPLTDETVWHMLNINEVYTVLQGRIWPQQATIQPGPAPVPHPQTVPLGASA